MRRLTRPVRWRDETIHSNLSMYPSVSSGLGCVGRRQAAYGGSGGGGRRCTRAWACFFTRSA
eukprot:4282036-Alexandrium_andersonii.AAC.1